jgi:tRNA-dihydrouridine synthase 1
VKEAVSVPVFANGNILFQSDIAACLAATGADGVMSAEGQLYNAALFHGLAMDGRWPDTSDEEFMTDSSILLRHPRHADVALEYLNIVRRLKTATSVSSVKGHLFKLMRPGLMREVDLREQLGRVKADPIRASNDDDEEIKWKGWDEYEEIITEMKIRMEVRSLSFFPIRRVTFPFFS